MSATSFDSDREQLGGIYARGILGAAANAGKAEEVVADLEEFVTDVLDKLPKLEAILGSLRLAPEQRVDILQRALKGRVSPILVNSLKVMAQHGRLNCLRETARAARKVLNELSGRVEVILRTAVPVSSEVTASIVTRLKAMLGKEVDLKTELQPEMLGGIMVRVGDTLYDGSVASRLETMRTEALNDTLQTVRAAPQRFEQK